MARFNAKHLNDIQRTPDCLREGEYTFELLQLSVRLIGKNREQERVYIVAREESEKQIRRFEIPVVWSADNARFGPDTRHLSLFGNLLAATGAEPSDSAEDGPSTFGCDDSGDALRLGVGRYDVPEGVCFTAKVRRRDANEWEAREKRCDRNEFVNELAAIEA